LGQQSGCLLAYHGRHRQVHVIVAAGAAQRLDHWQSRLARPRFTRQRRRPQQRRIARYRHDQWVIHEPVA
jgi:hypothetical protein